ncbi:MAG: AtpZ/AtpI family protein [Phycisphaerales bacterium]|nr:AtpZ/AtpI family protein [Phycisphaerales bacterium]
MKAPKPIKGLSPEVMRLANVGVELAAAVIGLSLLGYWIDYQLKTGPWGLLICAILGIVGGLYNLVRKAVREMLRPDNREENQSHKTKNDDK